MLDTVVAFGLVAAAGVSAVGWGAIWPTTVAVASGAIIAQPADVRVWVVDALENILRDAMPPERPSTEIILEAAQGEYESGQLAVRSGQAIANLRATVGALKSAIGAEIPASCCRCRFVGYVGVERNTPNTPPEELVAQAPGQFPDPLIERETMDVPAETAQPIWLTVYVPPAAPAGDYTGAVQLSWDGGRREIPVRVTVWPFEVPRERHLYFTNWVSADHIAKRYNVPVYSDEFWAIFEKFVANAAAHRQNIMWVSPHVIRVYQETDGRLSFDFSVFDRWVEICEKHGVADLIEISQLGRFKEGWEGREIVLHPWNVTGRASGKIETRPGREVLPELLAALQEHLRQRGWLSRTVLHIADEPSINNVESWREQSDWVHALAPEIRRIDAIEAPDFGDSLEIWVPKLSHYYNWQEAYERARQRGAELWFYTCCHPMGRYPNRFVDYPLIKTRILHWINWRYRLSGYLHWGLLFWTDDPFKSAISGGLPPGDAWIVYPGPDGPVDSIRWETLRDGLEDYEYLWLLTQTAARVKAELGAAAADFIPSQLADEFCSQGAPTILDYVRDPSRLCEIRRQIAQEIVSLNTPPRVLVWTQPPSGHTLAAGPAMAVLYVAAEVGTRVSINGTEVDLDKGFHAQNLFLSPGRHEIKVTASRGDNIKTVTRVLHVVQ